MNDPNKTYELIASSAEAIVKRLEEGAAKHSPGSWLNEPPEQHAAHMFNHLAALNKISHGFAPDDGEDHTAAIITRAVMLHYTYRQKKNQEPRA